MKNAAVHRENLVRTAMRLFRRQGYSSTGLQQILAESGAPKGSLYHYFPGGKEELGVAAIVLAGAMIQEMLSEHATRHADPKAFLRAYCRTMAGWMEESDFQSGCPVATSLLETAPVSVGMTQAGLDVIDGWIAVVTDVLARGGLERRNARVRAQLIVAAMEGALLLSRVRQSTRPILDVAQLI